jgi:hypothetical protein
LVVLIWGSIGFTTHKNVANVGPLHATKTKTHHIPYAPIIGAVIIIGGIAVLVTGRKS